MNVFLDNESNYKKSMESEITTIFKEGDMIELFKNKHNNKGNINTIPKRKVSFKSEYIEIINVESHKYFLKIQYVHNNKIEKDKCSIF